MKHKIKYFLAIIQQQAAINLLHSIVNLQIKTAYKQFSEDSAKIAQTFINHDSLCYEFCR